MFTVDALMSSCKLECKVTMTCFFLLHISSGYICYYHYSFPKKKVQISILSFYPYCSFICYITIVRDAEGHALSAPLLPEGDQSGLRDLSDDGGQMLLVAPIVAWRRGL